MKKITMMAVILGSFLMAESAQAETCTLKSTRDGFVALRAYPTTTSRTLVRLGAWIEVDILGTNGSWQRVRAYTDRHGVRMGFIHSSLIDWNSCN
jgi:hypothetical protein